jgi:hypothetical protein
MPVDRRGKPRNIATEIFTAERTKAVITRRKQDELLLAKGRGELVLKSLVEKQASYLLAAIEQTIMDLPLSFAGRILNLDDVVVAHRILKELSIALLSELRDLPQKITDPNWLRESEERP